LISIDAPNKDGETPLHLACIFGFTKVAQTLITKGKEKEKERNKKKK